MNKKRNVNKYIFWITGVVLFISLLYVSLNKNVNISLSYLKDSIYKPFMDITNNRSDLVGKSINEELVEENNSLKDVTKIDKTLSGFKNINATIVERNASFWMDSVTINKGKSSGIDIGMAVVVSEGLIGKVVSITNNTSVVRLITSSNNDNKISIKIKYKDTYIYKVLELENDKLIINGIENDVDIKVGSVVLTSGLSDIYPSGIIIGTVDKVESSKYGISKKLVVSSKVDFENLRFVSVLERET